MNFNQKTSIKFLDIKRKVEKETKKDLRYMKLIKRKEEILNYLNIMILNKEDKIFMEKYDKLGLQIKDIELQTAFEILTNNKKRKKIYKKLKKEDEEDSYINQFNKIVEDSDYKSKILKRKEIFKKISKGSKKHEKLLYELESIETEIATIETEKIKRLCNNVEE